MGERKWTPNDASQAGAPRPCTPGLLFVRTKSNQKAASPQGLDPLRFTGAFRTHLQVKSCGAP